MSHTDIHNIKHRENREGKSWQKLLGQLHAVKENVSVVTQWPFSLCFCLYVSVTGSYFRTLRF